MAITEKELKELIEPGGDIEKISAISSDGKTLVTRIPKDLVNELEIKKGDKFKWSLDKNKGEICLTVSGGQVIIQDEKNKKEKVA